MMANTTLGVGRWRMLGGLDAPMLGGIAGCTTLANWPGDKVLGHVNLSNEMNQRFERTVEIAGPDDYLVIDETFD